MSIISIVVPVYKVEKLLERCVKSLIDQSLEDIEIILVDDGSPDKSGDICDKLKQQDSRICVIHKSNGGLSSARNAGIQVAKGKYISFVDSDDDVELNMFEIMVNAAEEYSADFIMSDYIRIFEDGHKTEVSAQLENGLYEKKKIRNEIFPSLIMGENVDYGPLLAVWHCVYNREFLKKNRIMFADDVKWSEDNLFNSMVGYCADRFVYLKGKNLYHYYQNSGTITTSYRPGAWDVYKRMNSYMENFFLQKKDYDFERQLKLHLIYYACNTINMECKNADSMKIAKYRVKEILCDPKLREAFYNFKLPRNVDFKLKLQLWLMKQRYSGFLTVIFRG